jgi:hypothetical protein
LTKDDEPPVVNRRPRLRFTFRHVAILVSILAIGLSIWVAYRRAHRTDIPDGLFVQPGRGTVPRLAFRRDKLYGFLDVKGRVAIKPKYRWADDFDGGFALRAADGQGKYAVIDENDEIVSYLPTGTSTFFRADVDRIWYEHGDKWGLVDLFGNILIQPFYDAVDRFSDGLAWVNLGAVLEFPGYMEGGKSGFVDQSGKLAVPCMFDGWIQSFHDGYVVVDHQLVNKMGKAQFAQKGLSSVFSEGLIAARPYEAKSTRYLDAHGNVQLTVQGNGEEFSEQLAVVYFEEQFGYIDEQGQVVIPLQYSAAHRFSNGLAAVAPELDEWEGWGYIDRDGELVTPAHFNEALPAEKEFAIVHYGGVQETAEDGPTVWIGGRWLMIDRAGRPLAVIRKDRDEY